MNERIKELAFKAMSINQTVSDDSFFVEVSKLKEFEKFAELIVRECISQVDNLNHNSGDEWDKAMTSAANSIQEFFGVE